MIFYDFTQPGRWGQKNGEGTVEAREGAGVGGGGIKASTSIVLAWQRGVGGGVVRGHHRRRRRKARLGASRPSVRDKRFCFLSL